MNTLLRRIFVLITLLFTSFSNINAQDSEVLMDISNQISQWQPVIDSAIYPYVLYHYVWGESYDSEEWTKNLRADDDESRPFLYETATIIQSNKLGFYMSVESTSLSGDWFILCDYYYDLNNRLYFLFWHMNTFQSEVPVTVEKRLYFDNNGKKVKSLHSVYKMNTKTISKASFMDRDIDYTIKLEESDVHWAWEREY